MGSVREIPADAWARLSPPDDPVWAQSLFRAVEDSGLADGFRYVIAWNRAEIISILPLFWLRRWKLDDNMPARLRDMAASVRRVVPAFMTAPTLFCGTVLGRGYWLGQAELADDTLRQMLMLVDRCADGQGMTWLFYKDFTRAALERIRRVSGAPLSIVPALPDTELTLPFSSFEEYLTNLKLAARRNARRKIRCFERLADMRIESIRDFGELIPEIMRLYQGMYERAIFRFDKLNTQFFESVLQDTDLNHELLVCWKGDKLAAFALCLRRGRGFVNLRLGLDHDLTEGSFAYFVLHYESVRSALSQGCTEIGFSITTYEPKIELGCKLRPLFYGLTHRNKMIRPAFVRVVPLAMAPFDQLCRFPEHALPAS